MVVAAVQTAATAAPSGRGSIRGQRRNAKTGQRVIVLARRIIVYRSLFPARAGRALLRVLTSRGGIVRRFLGAFMLAAAVLTVAAAALTPALAGSAQAVSKPPPPVFGIRLVDVPVDAANNPRAYRYIIDHLNPGIDDSPAGPDRQPHSLGRSHNGLPGRRDHPRRVFRWRRRPDPQLPDHLDHPEPAQRVPGPARQGHGHRNHPGAADRLPREPLRRDLGAGNQPRENQQGRQHH